MIRRAAQRYCRVCVYTPERWKMCQILTRCIMGQRDTMTFTVSRKLYKLRCESGVCDITHLGRDE